MRQLPAELSADGVYMTSAYYDPERESGLSYDGPDVRIAWPGGSDLSPSARDAGAPWLAEIAPVLLFD